MTGWFSQNSEAAVEAAQVGEADSVAAVDPAKKMTRKEAKAAKVAGKAAAKEAKEAKEAREAREAKEAEGEGKDGANAADDDLSVRAMLLSLAHVYYYRLPREVNRQQLCGNWNPHWTVLGESLSYEEFDLVLYAEHQLYCDNMELGEGIAPNKALRENLFVMIVCIFNRIPLFVVGKPGTSKSLSMQIIANNLRGKQSDSRYWQAFPAVYVVPYQCSPMSTSASIRVQFDKACAYQQKQGINTVTVLLLDEVGLAEHSPDMPLKVLHEVLVDSPVAIVGISNWALDPAKMNRAVCLRRPEPKENDLQVWEIHHSNTIATLYSYTVSYSVCGASHSH